MTVVVLGLDALDPELTRPKVHSNLTLSRHRAIETIVSSAGEPSTHELWPSIITGMRPEEHGLTLDDGVAWGNPVLAVASDVADRVLPTQLQTRIGAWLLTNTAADAFRVPATYYDKQGLSTMFDGRESIAIGIPNYVTDTDEEDREQQLRRQMGELFQRDVQARGGHRSADPFQFYEWCLEMLMVRIARVRRALRSRRYELVFGYSSALDLVGHVAYGTPGLQERAYQEANDFVGELLSDLSDSDELLVVSDHGLQDGIHTEEAMVAGTNSQLVESIDSVLDVRPAVDVELEGGTHLPTPETPRHRGQDDREADVREHLEDLGYF